MGEEIVVSLLRVVATLCLLPNKGISFLNGILELFFFVFGKFFLGSALISEHI